VVESPRPEDFDGAFAALTKAHVRGLMVAESPYIAQHQSQILALAAKSRLAAIYEKRYWVEAGGLISYGVVLAEIQRRMAECVDKILRGAKPSEVPVQQPTTFELVINLKTAKALGVTIPQSLLGRADEVIQ
jgi:putative ABC transport system substrate-binding protein